MSERPAILKTEPVAEQGEERSPLTDSNRRPPLLPSDYRFAADCHRLQPRGSIKMTCSETSSAQACYPRGVVHVDGARGGPDDDRSRIGCASKTNHVQDARPRVG